MNCSRLENPAPFHSPRIFSTQAENLKRWRLLLKNTGLVHNSHAIPTSKKAFWLAEYNEEKLEHLIRICRTQSGKPKKLSPTSPYGNRSDEKVGNLKFVLRRSRNIRALINLLPFRRMFKATLCLTSVKTHCAISCIFKLKTISQWQW